MNDRKFRTIEEALFREYIDRDETLHDQIPPINNPFPDGDKARGFNDALRKLANALFGSENGGSSGNSNPTDPRLIQPPPPKSNNQNSKNQQSDSGKEGQQNSQQLKQASIKPLSKEELDELIDKVKAARNAANDVIDDNDSGDANQDKNSDGSGTNSDDKDKSSDAENSLDASSLTGDNRKENSDSVDGEKISKELDKLEQDAKDAKTQSDANKIDAKLKAIADFWNEDNIKKHLRDVEGTNQYRKLSGELRKQAMQARANAAKRNYHYKPMNINAIVRNICKMLENESAEIRQSSFSRYNPRSDSLGYVAPGRYTASAFRKRPSVAFYFDISNSWFGNQEKIDMGHRIEQALIKLDQQKKIELSCYYFGTKVHDKFPSNPEGNSDAPIPHALELLEAKQLDNIIIMTDDNPISNQKLQVPGYAWLLFYDTVSTTFASNVSGKRGTSIVMIDHADHT